MKKFKFKLQTVHNVREMRQEKEQLTLAQIQNDVIKMQERIKEIERMRFEAMKNYTNRLGRGRTVDPVELEINSKHISSLDRLKLEAEKELEEKRTEFTEQAKKVAQATQQVQVTKKLREKQKNRHKLETNRQEQSDLDELVSAKFARRLTETR